jgi:hypothetical protein
MVSYKVYHVYVLIIQIQLSTCSRSKKKKEKKKKKKKNYEKKKTQKTPQIIWKKKLQQLNLSAIKGKYYQKSGKRLISI